jgi:hypothetical protein
VPLPAAEAWRLHRNFGFTSFSADIDRQAVSLVEETVSVDGSGNHQMRRTFKMVFKTDPVPAALRGLLKTEEIEPIMREVWVAEVHDHEYSYQFTSDVAFFGDKLKVSGRQWFVPLDENRCTYHSRAEVRASYFPGMNGLLERAAAEKLEWAMSTFGDRAVLFLAQPQLASVAVVPGSQAFGAAVFPPAGQPGSPRFVLTAADVWLPVSDLYDAAAGVAAAPLHAGGGSALAAALELDDLAGDGRVPCACCCACARRVQQLTSSYASLGRDAALREGGGEGGGEAGHGAGDDGRRGGGGLHHSAGNGGGRSLSVGALRAPVSMVLQRLSKARDGEGGREADTAPMRQAVEGWRGAEDEAADEEDFGEIID